jgi:GTP:adenosylcobinamide-phosphate guanylyltransferase
MYKIFTKNGNKYVIDVKKFDTNNSDTIFIINNDIKIYKNKSTQELEQKDCKKDEEFKYIWINEIKKIIEIKAKATFEFINYEDLSTIFDKYDRHPIED